MVEIQESEKIAGVTVFDKLTEREHEEVVFCYDKATGLKAIIGIHNTVLGPALGGTRMWNYSTEQEALTDVLRLSRGMTFKAAISGLNAGGGKAVIIGDASKLKSEALMRRFGRFIDGLGGRYITAEDVNMTTRDMEYIRMETNHVTGLPKSMGGGGDPSPVTAYGIYLGMKALTHKVYGTDSLNGKVVLVQGVGKVGMHLVEKLKKESAKIFISDLSDDKLKNVSGQFGATVIAPDEVYDFDMDIYAPCALGATLNDDTIPRLKCRIIAGGANNQLADENKNGYMLMDLGIAYAPDFVINAGGLINIYNEFLGNYNRERAYAHTERIYDSILSIANESVTHDISSQEIAIKLAGKRIEEIGKVKLPY